MTTAEYTRTDFQTDQEVRWCPGCGDYTILASMQKYMAGAGIPKENVVFISGIGCAARFPYYMETYGLHSIHGRAPAIATGLATARPDLSVWVVGGDGDMMSIGGNHLIHALRRNVNIKILMFNNQIYGLTKGQYSPTSEQGKRTKSSPMGSVDHPFNPVSLALGAEATFVARTIDMDAKHTGAMLEAAHNHDGAAFVEIYQNCNVFNNHAFIHLTGKDERNHNRIYLNHGEPIVFGVDDESCVVMRNGVAAVTKTAGVDAAEIVVHDQTNVTQAFALSRLSHGPSGPTPLGVFMDRSRPTYESEVDKQLTEAHANKGDGDIEALIRSLGTWVVE